jgi:hypothetical protein
VASFKAALAAGGQPAYGLHYNIAYAYIQVVAPRSRAVLTHNPCIR